MMKIGIAGTTEKAFQHYKILENLPQFSVTGAWGENHASLHHFCKNTGVKPFVEYDAFLDNIQAFIVISPLSHTFSWVEKAIKNSKHIFIDASLFSHPDEALKLLELSGEAEVKVQVYYPERFHPVYETTLRHLQRPMYIEAQRHVAFSNQNDKISVVNDLMLPDIDMVLSIVKANIRTVHATGVRVFNGTPDIVNANLEFDNGAVANLTANRIASKNIHRIKFYQHEARLQADFLHNRLKILQKEKEKPGHDFLANELKTPDENSLQQAYNTFYNLITQERPPIIGLDQVYQNLKTVALINEKIDMLSP